VDTQQVDASQIGETWEITGLVKRIFPATRGKCGFLQNEKGGPDAFLPPRIFRFDGLPIEVGTRITVLVREGREGRPRAVEVISRLQDRTIDFEPFELTSWNDEKGYGFLTGHPSGRPIFVHKKTLKKYGVRVALFTYYLVRVVSNPKGFEAVEIRSE